MIRLLDIPGVPELEARLELLPNSSSTCDPVTRQRLEHILEFLGLKMGYWGGLDPPEVANDDWILEDDPEKDVVGWRRRQGWDITRPDGGQCRCYSMLRSAISYIEQGAGGTSKVQVEASIWRIQRDARQGPDPKQRKQDRSFLALGQPLNHRRGRS